MALNVKPLGDRVLVEPAEEKEVKKGGIIIPDSAKEKPMEGIVRALGTGKTDDSGITWRNISDGFFKTGTIGAIAVAESDPNVVYVGSGEHAIRGVMTHEGDGMYRSTDAGKTWKKIGLDASQHIARIIVHPKNPDVVFVAAQGALYSASQARGVFKPLHGGTT